MLEAVVASPGRLLFVAPCAECLHLIPRLRASGWTVDSCELADAGNYRADIGLFCLGSDTSPELLQLPRHLQCTASQWLALIQPGEFPQDELNGALDAWYLQHVRQPFDPNELQRILHAAAHAARALGQGEDDAPLLGHSKSIRELRKRLDALSCSRRPVLIEGETGVGKTLLATLLHQRAAARGTLRVVSAAESVANLFNGLHGGTLCLQQAQLLAPAAFEQLLMQAAAAGVRLLATRTSLPGSSAPENPACEVVIHVPLRQRQGDIVLLAEHFAHIYGGASGESRPFSESALSAMLRHRWPGNVRELAMRIRRALALSTGVQIQAADLGLHEGFDAGAGATLEDYKRRAEYQALCDALARHSSNLSLAAKSLGISRPTFYRLLHKHQLL